NLADGPAGEYLTDRLTDESLRFIAQSKDRPFFLYFPHYAVHTPIQAKQDLVAKYEAKEKRGQKNAAYAAMVESADESVGRILTKLDELRIADRTVIIFMSDNGGLASVTSNAPLRAGKGTAYEGGIREPMLIKWPGVARPGSVCDAPVISTDFYPTMLEMAGLPLRPQQHCDGLSLAPLLRQMGRIEREALFWHYPHYHLTTPFGAVRKGDWKLIEYYEDMRVELYNLKDDLSEQRDLAQSETWRVTELRQMLHAWRESVGAQMPLPNPNYDPARATETPGGKAKGKTRK
ncbi:MAG: sulfatase, partial [Planctomycetes bacterium]|nr:sulfatase [Planctomycetota bacterium]